MWLFAVHFMTYLIYFPLQERKLISGSLTLSRWQVVAKFARMVRRKVERVKKLLATSLILFASFVILSILR